jgi:hypothetical protein
MQLQLPIFPKDTQMVSDQLGIYKKDGFVQYIINGLPAYSHASSDLNAFRFITSNFIHQGLCRKVDIKRAFDISDDSVARSYKKFLEEGADGFFGADARKGKAHKLTGELRTRIQMKLDKGQSNYSIAKEDGVAESAIRYGIKQGYLTKKK